MKHRTMPHMNAPAPRMSEPAPRTAPASIRSAAIGIAVLLASAIAGAAQNPPKLTPVAPPSGAPAAAPAGAQKAPAAPLPPPLSRTEQRFRELNAYIKSKGVLDAQTRADVVALAAEIDTDLKAPTTDRDQMLRLLPARAQTAIWLDDSDAMDAAFAKLLSMSNAPEAVALAWGRELNAEARFEKTLEVLQAREFTTDARRIDAKILIGDAYLGTNRFEPAQAAYNSAPALGRTTDQLARIAEGSRRVMFGRTLFNKELSAIVKDQQKGDLPTVELLTSKGAVIVELFEDQAPNTVGNFIEHVEAGTYDGTSFHRFMRGFGIQGGDPATASGGAGGRSNGGWVIPDEHDRADHRPPAAGRLVMAKQPAGDSMIKSAQNSAGCQFTILTGPAESLDGFYTVFGRVLDGMDVVRRLRADDQIIRAGVLSKRNHEYRGVRLGQGAPGEYALPRPGTPLSPAQTGEAGL
jgi:cyclophilin family peptidyl-prolyl cis-trans isomerase